MKILVIGGMHGNEMLGIDLVRSLYDEPVDNVAALFANQPAIDAGKRYIDQDLNRSFSGDGTSTEVRRAQEILKICSQYDIVLDFHNTYCPNNDCGFVGAGATQLLCNTASALGLDRVVVADYDCINKYAPNCLSVEVSVDSSRNSVALWRELVAILGRLDTIETKVAPTLYKFIYRMTLEDKNRYNLSVQKLKAFEKLPEDTAQKLGVSKRACPIFIEDKFTPYNYGGILEPID